jgi:hypothetical protein
VHFGSLKGFTVRADRLLKFVKTHPDWREYWDVESDDEILAELRSDRELLQLAIQRYKQVRWGELAAGSVGAFPALSLKELERSSRKGDEKMLVLCGWFHPDGGLRGFCAYCGIEISTHEMTVDHLVPQSRGGSSQLDNLVPACTDCNLEKADRTAEEYIASLGGSESHIADWLQGLAEAKDYRKETAAIWSVRLSEHQRQQLGLQKESHK